MTHAALSPKTVHRALLVMGEVDAEDCREERIADHIVDLLVLAAAAGHDWREVLATAEMHASAEIGGEIDGIETDASAIDGQSMPD